MWKPNEVLDDYIVRPAPVVTSEPPREVSLRRTGEVEVLKPLTRSEVHSKPVRTSFKGFRPHARHQPLWFRRFIAVGSGALVMIALALVSAILVGINDPAAGPDVVENVTPDDAMTESEERLTFDIFSSPSFEPATGRVDIVRRSAKRRIARRPVEPARYRPRRYVHPLQVSEPKFVPTTLVIYLENGEIRKRIEPWVQTS